MGNHSYRRGNSLIERRPASFHHQTCIHTTVAETMGGALIPDGHNVRCNKIEKLRQNGSAHKGLSLNRQARSETKPTTSPFDFMQFLAQHVQGCVAAQCHLRHLPILQKEGDFVAGPMQPDDVQRIVFTRVI